MRYEDAVLEADKKNADATKVYCPLINSECRTDCINYNAAMVSKVLSIADWKSGKDIYEDNILQLASYEQLWNENFPDNPVKGFHIVRTGKEIAMFNHAFYKEFPKAFEAFLHLRELYNLAKEIRKLK